MDLPERRFDPNAIALGKDRAGRPVCLDTSVRLQHVLLLGGSGTGKSHCIINYAKQAVDNDEGLLLIDPHGGHPDSPYRTLVPWLQERGKKVHIIDFSSGHIAGFNPLSCPPGTEPSVVAANVLDQLSRARGDEDLDQLPSVERVLRSILTTLVECRLTLCEAKQLYVKDETNIRRWAIDNVKDDYTRDELRRLDALASDPRRARDYDQETIGPHNRLQRFLSNSLIRDCVGQSEKLIDLKQAMDRGEIILANLMGSPSIHETQADLVGRLLLGSVLFHAKRRENRRPFNVICDEASRFMFSGLPTLLGEVRKFGVSVFATLQWLEQAAVDPNVLAALLNVNSRIIFRMRDAEDAERIAHTSVPVNLERRVEALVRPTVVGHERVRLLNDATTKNKTRTRGKTKGQSEGWADTEGETIGHSHSDHRSTTSGFQYTEGMIVTDSETETEGQRSSEVLVPADRRNGGHVLRETSGHDHGTSKGRSVGTIENYGYSESDTEGTTDTTSHARTSAHQVSGSRQRGSSTAVTVGSGATRGSSEALKPILEDRPSAVHSLQNELYRAGQMLLSLPAGVALLNSSTREGPLSTLFQVPFVITGVESHEEFVEARTKLLVSSGSALPLAEAQQHTADRLAALRKVAPNFKPSPAHKRTRKTYDEPEQGEAW